MAVSGESVLEWSTTALTNGDADGLIGWAENQARSTVNNSARGMMAAIAKWRNLQNGSIISSGTPNAQAFSSGQGYTVTVPANLRMMLKIGPALTNTSSVTLNMDAIGAFGVLGLDGTSLTGGELVAGTYAEFVYSSGNWYLMSTRSNRSAFSAHKNSTDQVIAASADQQITFSTEAYDIGSDFNTGAGSWTPPVGRVTIKGTFYATGAISTAASSFISIYKNGGVFKTVVAACTDVGAGNSIVCDDVAAGTDSYTLIAFIVSTAGNLTVLGGSHLTWFQGSTVD